LIIILNSANSSGFATSYSITILQPLPYPEGDNKSTEGTRKTSLKTHNTYLISYHTKISSMSKESRNQASNFEPRRPPLLATSSSTAHMGTNPIASMQIPRPVVEFHASTNLLSKLAGDVLVACTVTFAVSPFLTVIDKAIVQKAAGTHSVLQSSFESIVNIARNPGSYVRSPMFLMMWGVYASTYCTGM
jgi:hypothetical protein